MSDILNPYSWAKGPCGFRLRWVYGGRIRANRRRNRPVLVWIFRLWLWRWKCKNLETFPTAKILKSGKILRCFSFADSSPYCHTWLSCLWRATTPHPPRFSKSSYYKLNWSKTFDNGIGITIEIGISYVAYALKFSMKIIFDVFL